MIAFNLMVPQHDKDKIISKSCDTFKIITSNPIRGGDRMHYFLIEADEEEMLVLKLKYGNKDVWKR